MPVAFKSFFGGLMRHFHLCVFGFLAAMCALLPLAHAEDVATYVVEDGAAPWSDRVGAWELGDVPDSLKSKDPIPQQSCSARSLTIAGKPKSITLGVAESDAEKFKEKFPSAKQTDDKFTIRHPKETSGVPYVVMTLPNPPETISGGDAPFNAGLVLLKTDTGSTTQPAKS